MSADYDKDKFTVIELPKDWGEVPACQILGEGLILVSWKELARIAQKHKNEAYDQRDALASRVKELEAERDAANNRWQNLLSALGTDEKYWAVALHDLRATVEQLRKDKELFQKMVSSAAVRTVLRQRFTQDFLSAIDAAVTTERVSEASPAKPTQDSPTDPLLVADAIMRAQPHGEAVPPEYGDPDHARRLREEDDSD